MMLAQGITMGRSATSEGSPGLTYGGLSGLGGGPPPRPALDTRDTICATHIAILCTAMPRIQANGIRLYYELRGAGSPLTLVEGIGYASWMWFRQVGPLSAYHRLLIYDNRDVGNSQRTPVPYTVRDMAADLAGLLDALGIARTHLLGISMGGFVAQEFALAYPERLDHLILACTAFGGSHMVPIPQETQRLMVPDVSLPPAQRIPRAMAPAFASGFADSHAELLDSIVRMRLASIQAPDAWLRQAQAVATFDTSTRLGAIAAPTLILHGDADRVVPVQNARLLAERLPHADLRILSGGGHLVFIEQAENFNQAILDFLR